MSNEAAGIFLTARDTGRVLLALRSRWVSESGVWSPPGGKVEPGETPEQAARRELKEEIGYSYRGKLTPVFVFRSGGLRAGGLRAGGLRAGGFRFHNFIGTVPHEFTPVLNEESDDARWFAPTDMPRNLHFGMKAMMGDLRKDLRRTMRANPGVDLVGALKTLAGKTRAFSLSEYMRLEKSLSAAKPFPLPEFRQYILYAMSQTVFDR